MSQVPIQRTPISMREYARAVILAWRAELGTTPSKAAAGVLWAQYMIETGGRACWCWNIGNVKVTAAQVAAGVDWFDLPGTWEIINGQRVVLAEGDPGRRFRAYDSLAGGMTEHLRFLRNRRYATAWPSVEAGDCDAFARRLKAAGYYTAPADAYAKGMLSHHKPWMASPVFDEELAQIVATMDAPTEPELPPASEPIVIVHPAVPLGRPALDELDDPDPEAA